MPRIQEEVTSYSWELLLRFLGISGEVISNTEKAFEFTFDKAESATRGLITLMIQHARKRAEQGEPGESENEKVLLEMKKRVEKNHEEMRNVLVADEDAEAFAEKLRENNVLFVARDIEQDDAKMFVFLSGDEFTVERALTSLMADRGFVSEMDAETFLDTRTQNGVGTVDGLDDAELEAFREYARKEELPFAKITVAANHNVIIYEPEKADETKRTLAAAVWALSGPRGEEARRTLGSRAEARRELYKAIEDKKEHVIVSVRNKDHLVLLDEREASLYKNGQLVSSVSRENKDFFEKTLQMTDGLGDVAVLNKGEYALNGTKEKLKAVFHEETATEKAPKGMTNDQLAEHYEERNERRRLIEEKMALDDENQNPFWIFDNGYSYSEATTNERIDDRDDDLRDDMETVNKVQLRLKEMDVEETVPEAPRGLDAIIARATQRRDEKIRDQKEQDRREPGTKDFFKV